MKKLVSVSSSMPKDYENAINLVGGWADSLDQRVLIIFTNSLAN